MRIVLLLSLLLSLSLYGTSCKVDTYIPINASKYKVELYETFNIVFKDVKGDIPIYYTQALIEHESCVHLCGNGYWARRCWNPISRLKTYWDKNKKINREEGAGLFQLTRAWRKNGTLRLDTITSLKKRYPNELKELHWGNVYVRPDLQMKAGLLLWRSNYKMLNNSIDDYNKMLMSDSIYNGGYKYFNRERKKCGLKKGCNPNIWLDNVEVMNARGTRILYGKRTSHDINRHHVRDVLKRMPKYKKDYYKDLVKDNMLIQTYSDGSVSPFYGE